MVVVREDSIIMNTPCMVQVGSLLSAAHCKEDRRMNRLLSNVNSFPVAEASRERLRELPYSCVEICCFATSSTSVAHCISFLIFVMRCLSPYISVPHQLTKVFKCLY